MNRKDTEQEILHGIIGILAKLRQSMRHAMMTNNAPLSPLYFLILKIINDHKDCTALMVSDLSARDKGQVTRLLKELDKHSFIVKKPNHDDKRSYFLELSPAGQAFYDSLNKHDLEALEAMTRDIKEEDLQHFLSVAEMMNRNLQKHLERKFTNF